MKEEIMQSQNQCARLMCDVEHLKSEFKKEAEERLQMRSMLEAGEKRQGTSNGSFSRAFHELTTAITRVEREPFVGFSVGRKAELAITRLLPISLERKVSHPLILMTFSRATALHG